MSTTSPTTLDYKLKYNAYTSTNASKVEPSKHETYWGRLSQGSCHLNLKLRGGSLSQEGLTQSMCGSLHAQRVYLEKCWPSHIQRELNFSTSWKKPCWLVSLILDLASLAWVQGYNSCRIPVSQIKSRPRCKDSPNMQHTHAGHVFESRKSSFNTLWFPCSPNHSWWKFSRH